MKKRNFFFCLGGFLSAAMSLLILIGLVWTGPSFWNPEVT